MYGGLRNFSSPINLTPDFIPFRQLGQYEDPELEGLYYNRFRYYDCSIGNYISQDPIGLAGNNPTMYGYVHDSNKQVDPFGLDCKKINVGDSGHHVPAVRKSKGRPFAVSRSDKTRPTFHFKGTDPGHDHWKLHNAERKHIGPRQGDFKGTDQELMDAYKKAYEGLDDIKVDVKSPDGTYNLGTDVTPKQGVELVESWLKTQGLF
ncbi:RHS repeat-associated core domain-containing protein [Flavobacterium covae]|uniref:RHS repeat-associated core domain-containing protein n=1 Tax=Flavobacterium covae TaxID=2906076 RepID=UPI0039A516B1